QIGLGGQFISDFVASSEWNMHITTLLILIAIPYFLVAAGGITAITETLPKMYPGFWSIRGIANTSLSVGAVTFLIWLIFPQVSPFFAARGFCAKDDLTLIRATPISVFFYIAIPMTILSLGIPSLRLLLPNVNPAEQVFVQGLMKFTPPLVAGIAAGGILGAVISTIDSILLCVGFGLSRDIYKSAINPEASEKTELIVARLSQLVGVVIAALLALRGPGGLWWVSTYANGIIVSGWTVPIFGGFWFRWATKEGALASIVAGPVAYLTASVFKILPSVNPIYWGLGFSAAAFVIVSKLTRPSTRMLQFYDQAVALSPAEEFITKAVAEGNTEELVRRSVETKKIAWGMAVAALLFFGWLVVTIGLRVKV
ncbi:MAG: sodium:solute symporter family protein, partial [Bacillota bacterium]